MKDSITNLDAVDRFVQGSILRWPRIYSNRTDVLHHILCSYGTGYVWENGAPVDDLDDSQPLWTPEREWEKFEERNSNRTFIRDTERRFCAEMIQELASIIETVDVRVHLRGEISSFGRESEYALIMNVPSNIHPDWAAAVEEMQEMAKTHGWKF